MSKSNQQDQNGLLLVSHNMTARRITRIVDAVRLWPFFREGMIYEAKYLRYNYPLDVYRRILFYLVYKNPNAWVGVVFDDLDAPIAFVLAHDVTPLFTKTREFEVSMFFYRKGFRDCVRLLQDRLDDFCRENGVCSYYLSTSSSCSSAERVFKGAWDGLGRPFKIFKRKVSNAV